MDQPPFATINMFTPVFSHFTISRELLRFQKDNLDPTGVRCDTVTGNTANSTSVFCHGRLKAMQ